MSLPKFSVRRPISTAMLLLSILIFGGIALDRLPLAFLPELDVPFIGIEVPYPNSNPLTVEKEIAKPVEEALSTLAGIKKMRSTSDADGAFFQLEFDWGEEIDIVRMQVSEKMDQIEAELPEDVGEVAIFSFNTSDIPVVQGRISAQNVDLSENYDLLEARVLNRLRRVPGVGRVDLDGVEPKEIFIDLVLDKIREHSVDVESLIQQLQGAGSNMVLGQIDDEGLRYSARSVTSFTSTEQIAGLIIDDRGLRLGDIAEISYEEPPIGYARLLNRKEAIALIVFKESTANTVDVVRATMKVIEEDIANDPLLEGVDVFVWQDQAEEIVNAVDGLTRAGIIGAILAVVVLWFFLRRFDSTLIVSMAIPFSIIAACGVLYFLGKNLNILSMMGLMLGVGMLVDNAIVVLESIDRRSREVRDSKEAALQGANAVWLAVTASTITTLVVFAPLIVGDRSELTIWLGEIGLTIALSLVCSLFVSLTLIPMVSSRFLKPKDVRPPRFLSWLEVRYVAILRWTLAHKGKTFLLLTLGLGVGFAPFSTGLVETSPFSAAVNQRLFLRYTFQDFAYMSESRRVVEKVEAYLDAHRDDFHIESLYSFYQSNRAETTITLSRRDLDDQEIKDLRKKIREGLPVIAGVKVAFDEDTDQGGGSTYFSVNFYGQDSGVLTGLAAEAQRQLETLEGIADVSSTLGQTRKEIEVKIDRAKAARLGLSAQEMTQVFGFTLGGLRLPRFNAGSREADTWLALRLEDRENTEDLRQLQIREVDGLPILLGDIATFQVVERPQEIQRRDRKVRVGVRATYEGEEWESTRETIEEMMNGFGLPAGYSWSWNDRILEQDDQGKTMGLNFLMAILFVYLIMASLFESLAQPFAILFSIPFALPGVAWMLAATGTPFNLMSQIGLLILMGIVVNNGIVLLDHMNQLRASGLSDEEAILAAGRDRMRAILMTASTTIIGLMPLAFGSSRAGGLFYYPLALTVMGGLMSSAVLTLVVLPYVNLGMEGVGRWLSRLWSVSEPKTRAGRPGRTEAVLEVGPAPAP